MYSPEILFGRTVNSQLQTKLLQLEKRLETIIATAPTIKTPYKDLSNRLLRVRMAVRNHVYHDQINWIVEKLEKDFFNRFGRTAPQSLLDLYCESLLNRLDKKKKKSKHYSTK